MNAEQALAESYTGKFPRYPGDFTDLEKCITEFVLPGFIPNEPPLSRNSKIMTIGSCFSRHIANNLIARGMNVNKLELPEITTTPETIRRALIANPPKGYDALIVTLGIGDDRFEQLVRVIGDIARRGVVEDCRVILTVSPAPLNRSFHPSAVAADCVSKSLLRSALAEALQRTTLPNVYYWPSFEIVRWLGAHLPRGVYGNSDGICRHVDMDLVALIMDLWVKYWVAPTQ